MHILARARQLMEDIIQVGRDVVGIQRGRNDQVIYPCALARFEVVHLPAIVLTPYIQLKAAVDIEFHAN